MPSGHSAGTSRSAARPSCVRMLTTADPFRARAPEDHPNVTIVSERAGEFVRELRGRPGKDIALFGGARLFRSLLDAGQVEIVEVSLIPVLLGAGVPLMPPPYGAVPLRLTKHKVLAATISLEYAITGQR